MSSHEGSKKKIVSKEGESVEEVTVYSGQLPKPDVLRAYNDLIPNAGERLLTIVEVEQKERILLQNKDLDTHKFFIGKTSTDKRIGMFVSAFVFLVIAGLCAYGFKLGYPTQSAAIFATVVAIVGYITQQRKTITKE